MVTKTMTDITGWQICSYKDYCVEFFFFFFLFQLELITQQAMRAGFTGGLVVDFPNSTKAKK